MWKRYLICNFILLNIGNTGDNDDDDGNHEAVASVSLSCCGLLPADLGKVWRSLGTSPDLTLLEYDTQKHDQTPTIYQCDVYTPCCCVELMSS